MSYVNPFHYALTALLLFAAVFFTAASAGETNLYGGLIVPPIAWSTPPKPPKTGDFKDDLKHPTTNAFITRYRLFVPEKLPKKRHLALLICFHGRGGNEDGPAELMNRTIKDLGLSDQYIVMGLKSHEIGWEDADEIDVLKAYDWVSSVYPIDLRRVYLIGHSSGAHWDTHFGSKHIDLFAGIMRWAGGSIRPLGGKDAALQTEFYFVHGTKDDQNAISSSREGRDHLKRAGCRYVFREVLTGDHGNILSMAPITHDLVWWMDSLRHKTMPLPVDDDKFLKQFATAKLRDKLLPQAETWNELLRIGGPQAGQVVAEAMTSPTAKIREFAALACTKGRFGGEETVAELAKLVDDKSAAVRTATIAALGVEANWRSETAQRALGELALSKKKVELTDRGDATIQLAKAATLPLLGNYDDDTPLWQALIGLLNDERREIRTAAFSPLKIAVPDGNGYDPTATGPERAAAIAKWQAWLTAHQLSEENKAAK